MKKTNLKTWSKALGMISILGLFSFHSASAATPGCAAEKIEFKKLYLELQAQFLNYEGKDTVVDAKGNMTLVPHDPKKEYEGKVFEGAVYQEYQNSLKKVAKLYQAAKFGNDADNIKKSTPGLVEFLKAIEDSADNSAYVQKSKINDVIEDLYKASNTKFGNSSDKKFVLNENDKYLLKKLLTHAQDRLCTLETFEKTGKGTTIFRDTNYLTQVRNAPLNRLIGALKNAKITADSDFLVDEKVAITSAMSQHMNQLAAWMKRNEACRKAITNPGFIQANVQSCNYNKFLDVLNEKNLDELQSVLHFINANERLLNRPQAKAETALDELKLESVIDSTFANLGNAVNCSIIEGPNNKKRIFVRNLPYHDNKFDTSKIVCKVKDKELKAAECSQKIELVSDEFGRGIELRQKAKSGAAVSFSIAGNANCDNLNPSNGTLSLELKTAEMCLAEGKKLNPPMVLVPSEDKKSCVDPATLTPKTTAICLAEGQNRKPSLILFPSEDKKTCVDPATLTPKTDEICLAEGQNRDPKVVLVPSEDKKTCIVPGLKTAEMCKAEGEAMNPKKSLILSEDKKSCIEDPNAGLKTAEMCKAEGEAMNPKKILVPAEDKKSCIEKTGDNENDCKVKNDEWIKNDNDGRPGIKFEWNAEKKTCLEKSNQNDGESKCIEQNNKWIENDNDGRPGIKFEWNSEKKDCINKRPDKDSGKKSGADAPEAPEFEGDADKQPPARFVPINIPTRQMYVLPGMP